MEIVKPSQTVVVNPARAVPNTGRGRALHSIDWFLNGRPALGHHDHPQANLGDIGRR